MTMMLRATCLRTLPLHGALAPVFLPASCRGIAHSTTRANALVAPPPSEKSTVGAEGLHRHQKVAGASSPLTKEDGASTVPQTIHGDWVLFHPVYTTAEVKSVEVLHREPRKVSESIARGLVKIARFGYDFVTRYREKPIPPNSTMTTAELRAGGYLLSEHEWLNRILFLETTAAVPGMVAATIRHLQSLRLMKRDSGWIHTLLEEAENERMHLMTFMTLRRPSWFFRTMVLGAQGVFYNMFFLSYILSPNACHRFVAYLEEEAVHTYTKCIQQIEAGHLPEWTDKPAPPIAIDYWRLPPSAKMLDVIYAVRSDESTHRFVNHSLANLNTATDANPFALREPDMTVKGTKLGFERAEAEQYMRESQKILRENAEARA